MKRKLHFLIFLLLFGSVHLFGQNWEQLIKLTASDRGAYDNFGNSVAIYGNYAVVGSHMEDEDAEGANTLSSAGSAYIFKNDGVGNWTQIQKIVASDRAEGDAFGYSVSIYGNYIVVGAKYEAENASGSSTLSKAGSAYIFKNDGNDNWTQIQKIVASDRKTNDYFGTSVSFYSNYLLVGAQQSSYDANNANYALNSGAAYIFKNDGNDNWSQLQKIVASDRTAVAIFGSAVSLYENYAVIGALGDGLDETGANAIVNAGSAYIFKNNGSDVWTQIQKVTAPVRFADDYFGNSVSVNGNYFLVGAVREDEDENETNSKGNAGSAYIFKNDGADHWSLAQKIVASDRGSSDYFGKSVMLYGDYFVVGAEGQDTDANGGYFIGDAGAAYIFKNDGAGNWSQTQKIVANQRFKALFGNSVAIYNDQIITGGIYETYEADYTNPAIYAGAAYIFQAQTNPIYVNLNATGNNDGSSWDNAYTSLQDALTATTSFDKIWIAKGTYTPSQESDGSTDNTRDYIFAIPSGVVLYGGFDGTETDLNQRTNYAEGEINETILNGDIYNDDDGTDNTIWDNCYAVVDNSTFVYNITISGSNPALRIFVKGDATGTNDGSSWTNAFTSLQTALNQAVSGDNIWVAKGTYKPEVEVDGTTDTQRKYSFKLVDGVKVYGGFAGTESAVSERSDYGYGGVNETILSGDFNGDDVITGSGSSLSITNNSDNAYHVIYHPASYPLTSSTVLDGFSIIGGNANGSANPYNDGGGLYNSDGQIPTINNCSFYGNRASDNGGAIMNVNSDSMVLSNCKLFNNYAADDGAAISNYSSDVQIINCVMNGNRSVSNGGGVYNYSASNPAFISCTIADNYAVSGGGIFNDENSDPSVINCILWGNTLSSGSGTQIRNYNNSDLTISYCNVEGGLSVGITSTTTVIDNGGNIDSDPMFAGSTNNSSHPYSISSISPCGDVGYNDANSLTTDIRGADYGRKLSKVDGTAGTIDIGAYEYKYIEDLIDPNLIFVNQDASGNNTGINWKHAFTSFQTALEAASSGRQIWVAKGTYKPSKEIDGTTDTPGDYTFQMVEGVEIYGGFAGTETEISTRANYGLGEQNETILSGDLNGDDVVTGIGSTLEFNNRSDNTKHLFYHQQGYVLTNSTVLDGFTIKGAHNTVTSEYGGGIYNHTDSDPTIQFCTFTENFSTYGGGIGAYHTRATISNCVFVKNSAFQRGAGIQYAQTGSSGTIKKSIFYGNRGGEGGGISAGSSDDNPVQIINCLFYENYGIKGGGIFLGNGPNQIINNTLVNNTSEEDGGGAIYLQTSYSTLPIVIKNTIAWNNTANTSATNLTKEIYSALSSKFSIYNSDIEYSGGSGSGWSLASGIDGGNNIDQNPQFVGSSLNASHPYSIYGSSPCVDAGDDAANSETYDIRGSDFGRKLAKADGSVGTIDIGAYEYKFGTDPDLADIIYVDASATGENTGFTWEDALNSVQDALDIISSGNQIWVAKGTYKPSKEADGTTDTPRNYTFVMKDSVAIYGGFAGTETDPSQRSNYGIGEANETILSGDLNDDDLVTGSGETLSFSNNEENCYNVIKNSSNYLDAAAILDGFTISGGNASNGFGGGMYNVSSSPRIINCSFTKNSTSYAGGGVYVGGLNTAISFENCTFSNNLATGTTAQGGGLKVLNSIDSPTITNCTFSGNRALIGGGIYNFSNTTQINNCTFSNNYAGNYGGGIYNYTVSNNIKNSKFLNNSASIGGGLYLYNSSPIITNSLFAGNSARISYGGGIFAYNFVGTLINCTVAGNSASNNGGGIYLTGLAGSTITNTVVWSNTAATGAQNIYTAATAPNISYCNIEGSGGSSNWGASSFGTDGGNNIDADPLFVGSDLNTSHPYSLYQNSPCTDAGYNTAITEPYDIRGEGFARKLSKTDGTAGTVDIGAYEYLHGTDLEGPAITTTWTGATDTDYTNPANWSNGAPSNSLHVIIPNGSNVEFSGAVESNNLEVEAGGKLTITQAGSLTSSGSVTLKSNATSSGSLIISGSYSGPDITYQRYMLANQWHMFGSPLTGQSIHSFITDTDNAIITDGFNYKMKHYIEGPTESWSTDYTASTTGDITLGNAYVVKRGTDGTVSLIGQPNNGTVNSTITRDAYGWNLLGNPFTSSIAATNGTANGIHNLISVNEAVLDPSYASVYVWEENTDDPTNVNNYRLINHADSDLAQEYLQVGQGFFVRSKAGGETFTITPAMQSHQTTIPFKTSHTDWTTITLNASINNAKASTRISYREDMNRGLDIGYDAGLLNSYPEFALYSRLVEDNGVDFALQCLPTDFDNLIIPIGLDAKSGEIVSFSADISNLNEEYAVILEDKANYTFTSLSDGGEYNILLTDDNEGTGRFYVHTNFKSALGFDDLAAENTFQVFSLSRDNQIVIRGDVIANTSAKIFSITGKLMGEIKLKQSQENRISFNKESGIYIIQITNAKGTFIHKFSWLKYN